MKALSRFVGLCLLSACSHDKGAEHLFYSKAEKLASRMDMNSISSKTDFEIRLWQYSGPIDHLQLTVVTKSKYVDCSLTRFFNEELGKFIQHKHCSEYDIGMNEETLSELIASNKALDGQSISCFAGMDVEAGFIEGTLQGKWFALEYETPDECKTKPVLLLFEEIEKIQSLIRNK